MGHIDAWFSFFNEYSLSVDMHEPFKQKTWCIYEEYSEAQIIMEFMQKKIFHSFSYCIN